MEEIIIKYSSSSKEKFNEFFFCQSKEEILSNEIKLIRTGIMMEIPKGLVGSIYRSSSLIPFEIMNLPGTIDSDYRKEIQIILFNPTKETITIDQGEKIAQLKINPFINSGDSATEESAGSDLRSMEDLNFKGWKSVKLQKIIKQKSNTHIQYRSRSGLALKGVRVYYCSNIKQQFLLLYSNESFQINKGDRIAQAVSLYLDRKENNFFSLDYFQEPHKDEIISFNTHLKNLLLEFQIPNIPGVEINILNNPSCGGEVVVRIITKEMSCYLNGLFARIFFYPALYPIWQEGQITDSNRGSFGSTGI